MSAPPLGQRERAPISTDAQIGNWVGTVAIWAVTAFSAMMITGMSMMFGRAQRDRGPFPEGERWEPSFRQQVGLFIVDMTPVFLGFLFMSSIACAILWAVRGKYSVVPAIAFLLLTWAAAPAIYVAILICD